MAARAAEALEHQAKYRKMFTDPRYIEYQKVVVTRLLSGLSEAAEVEAHIANIGSAAARVGAEAGETYWWDPRICTLIESVYEDMPPWVMTRHALPSPSGFFWFEKPIMCGGRAIKAFFWGLMVMVDGYDPGEDQPAPMLAIKAVSANNEHMNSARGVVACSLETPPEEPISLTDQNGNGFMKPKTYYPDPRWERPRSTIVWSFNRGHDDIVGNDLNPLKDHLGRLDEDDLAEVHDIHGRRVRDDASGEAKILAACLAFLQQRFLTTHKQRLTSRNELRRLAKSGIHNPEVRVIALRKAFNRVSGADRQSGDPVEWSCRWIVGGHWRNQWYPSLGRHEPIYILPFLKGQEDKELKRVPESVFSVYR